MERRNLIPPPFPNFCRAISPTTALLRDGFHGHRRGAVGGVTRKTVTTIFLEIRGRVAEEWERQSPFRSGEVEVGESYFGPRRVRGKHGRGAGGKTILSGR